MKKNILQCILAIIIFLFIIIIPSTLFKWTIKIEVVLSICLGIIFAYVLKPFFKNRKNNKTQ